MRQWSIRCKRLSAVPPPVNTTTGCIGGPFLADLPWHAYIRRVKRTRKPSERDADYSQIFFYDKHYSMSVLYCQHLGYNNPASIPRLVGSVCPPEEDDNGEPYAAYNLMLFSRIRCPGPGHCADPLIFRPLLTPKDKPVDKNAVREKPFFAPCWKCVGAKCTSMPRGRQRK